MSQHHSAQKRDSHPSAKTVFLSDRKVSQTNCVFFGICLGWKQTTAFKEIQILNKNKANYQKSTKIIHNKNSKKSLKSQSKINEFFSNTVPVSNNLARNGNFSHHISKSMANLSQGLSRTVPFNRTNQSQRDFYKKPVGFYSHASSFQKLQFSQSTDSLNKNLQSVKIQSHPPHNGYFIKNIPLIDSIHNAHIKSYSSLGVAQTQISKQPIRDISLTNKIKYIPAVSQNFSSLPISPAKPIVILEESQQQGMNSGNPTDRDDNLTKTIQLKSPPTLNKYASDYSETTLRTTMNQKEKNSLETNLVYESIPEEIIQRKSFSEQNTKQNSSRKQNDIDKKSISSIKFSQIHKEKSVSDVVKDSGTFEIRVHQEEPKPQIRQSKQSKSSAKQRLEKGQKLNTTFKKTEKNPDSACFRYSVQIPKSKNFSHLKVRRTISMKDQQDSSEEQTSEVIYGFRKINNLDAMEDIAEDMLESCMTNVQQKTLLSNINSFRNF